VYWCIHTLIFLDTWYITNIVTIAVLKIMGKPRDQVSRKHRGRNIQKGENHLGENSELSSADFQRLHISESEEETNQGID
jgi:hypothetical protein